MKGQQQDPAVIALLKWHLVLLSSLESIMEVQRLYLEQNSVELVDRWLHEWSQRLEGLPKRPPAPVKQLIQIPPAFDEPPDELLADGMPRFYLARTAWLNAAIGMFVLDGDIAGADQLRAAQSALNRCFFEIQRAFEGGNVSLLTGELDRWRCLRSAYAQSVERWLTDSRYADL